MSDDVMIGTTGWDALEQVRTCEDLPRWCEPLISAGQDEIERLRAALAAREADGGKVGDVPHCKKCGTHEVALLLECQNSSCEGYAGQVTIYEGWKQPRPVAQPAAVPDGFVMVPVEPTREMIAAGCAANDGIVSDIYMAMVSQAVNDSLTAAVPRVPFSMPDAAVERIYDAAWRAYRRFKSSARGQIVTQADAYEWHVINATLDELRAMLAAAKEAGR